MAMESRNSNSGTYIEGVGDEVVLFTATVVSVILPILILLYSKRQNNNVHPENQIQVENARTHLGIDDVGSNQRRFYSDDRCPICLQIANLPIDTNCGHLFCAQCIIAYWQHGNWLSGVLCPVCRQRITLIMCNFNRNEVPPESAPLISNINDFNKRFSGEPRPILDYIRDIPALLRNLWRDMFTLHGLLFVHRLWMAVCLIGVILYFISPLDILPEAIFGIVGFIDDVLVLLVVIIYITILYRNIVVERP